jgi:hypothetical protein
MPIHDFDKNAAGPANLQEMRTTKPVQRDGFLERDPSIAPRIQTTQHDKRTDLFYENININTPEDVIEILTPGFHTMDRGMKNYFSGIRIPTKNGTRMMGVRVAGGDKSFLVWSQDLKRGRTRLPVLSISRDSATQHLQKFSPPYLYAGKRFAGELGDRVVLNYRTVPYLLEYSLSIWAEHKSDAEYASYQILTRFNSTAEFLIEDQFIKGTVFLKLNSHTDSSDKEIDPETLEKVRYDISITAEGWLPLPEKVVPTILGRVTNFKEDTGEFLDTDTGIGGR